MTLVIKKWSASEIPDENGNCVHLVGRSGGAMSWLLSLFKIDPTIEVEISNLLIKFTSSSYAGKEIRIVPLQSISSAYYGYEKPWKMALFLTILLPVIISILVGSLYYSLNKDLTIILLPIITGLIMGPIYYHLNKDLNIAVVEGSGWVGGFSFKRSVIEGQNINEQQAYEVIEIIRNLIEKKSV